MRTQGCPQDSNLQLNRNDSVAVRVARPTGQFCRAIGLTAERTLKPSFS